MLTTRTSVFCALAIALSGCGSGDIDISPSTVDSAGGDANEGSSGGGGDSDPCAAYVTAGGQTISGEFDGTNCTYGPEFADSGNNILVDLTIPDLPDGGVHIFEGSLFVGEVFESDAGLQEAGIQEGGDGPRLTIEAGATLAFQSQEQFIVINRGAQIFAVGNEQEPITFTSVSDVQGALDQPGTDGAEAVQQWGGMVINGFGVTNDCAYTGNLDDGTLELDGECHVQSEGSAGQDENRHGGNNNGDNSGRLNYVIVKHTGAQVASGDELNGITFAAVGSGTVVENLEVYSTFDDGIEMFGGAVDITNFAAVYARDDAIDIDSGYRGDISTALVIQSETDGNHCIESDGIASFDDLSDEQIETVIDQGINSRPTINNLTCIVSANGADTATHDPGAGWRFREGIFPTVDDSMVVGSFIEDAPDADNYCLRVDNRSQRAFQEGDLDLNSIIFACQDPTHGGELPNGTRVRERASNTGSLFAAIDNSVDPTPVMDTQLQLLEGTASISSIAFQSMVVNDESVSAEDPPAGIGAPENGSFIGALSESQDNPFTGWTFGIFEGNRTQPLFFADQQEANGS